MERINIVRIFFVTAVLALGTAACSGYGATSPTPVDNPPAPPAGAIVINVARIDGDRSFSPNPATVPPGQTVVWHNVDTVVHRVVLNAGGLDTGDIAPGAFSQPMTLVTAGPYHCSLHPSMVGTMVANP
jgi:plastocyanin